MLGDGILGGVSINTEDIDETAKQFFLLQDTHKGVLSDEALLTEIHRRVSVFFDASGDLGIYDAYKSLYENTPYSMKNSKQQYSQGLAQGFISLLLFGNDTHKIESIGDVDYINSRLDKLFHGISSPQVDEIKNMLHKMIKRGYPQYNVNRSGLLNDIQTPLKDLFEVLDLMRRGQFSYWFMDNFDINSVIYDLVTIKRNFAGMVHAIYVKEDSESKFQRRENLDLSITDFTQLLTKTISFLSQLGDIRQNELELHTKVMNIVDNDTINKAESRNITKRVKQHIEQYTVCSRYDGLYGSQKKPTYYQITKDNFHNHDSNLVYFIDDNEVSSPLLGQILKEYSKYKKLKGFDKYMGKPNYKQIEQDKQQVGAKGAYMNALKLYVDRLNSYIKSNKKFQLAFHETTNVPQYDTIPASYYDLWKSVGRLDVTYFRELYEKRKAKNIFVIEKSSAFNSEDNEVSTGSEIYHSEIIRDTEFTFEEFCRIIEEVYQSYESEKAIEYRKKQGIEGESMGIVLQEHIEKEAYGYVNSIVQHRPELLEVISGSDQGFNPLINKGRLETSLLNHLSYDESVLTFHYIIDTEKREYDKVFTSENSAGIAFLLERYFGKPIQLEFAKETRYDNSKFRGQKKIIYHILNVKPLPEDRSEKHQIDFPENLKELRKGKAIGVCDVEYDVLPTGDYNNDKVGVVIFVSNQHATLCKEFVKRSLPKDGAVIIMKDGGDEGYIERLCVERGLTCFFPTGENRKMANFDSHMRTMNKAILLSMGAPVEIDYEVKTVYDNLKGYKKVRVVANGYEGRVYGVDTLPDEDSTSTQTLA